MPDLNVKRIVVFIISAVGFIAACIALYPWILDTFFPEDRITLVNESELPPLGMNFDQTDKPIVYSRINIDSELVFQNKIQIVTNELNFGPEGKLVAPQIDIFATRVSGGTLDVSGNNAQEFGDSGEEAGTIFIAAASVKDTKFIASGGNGKKGENGSTGKKGKNGQCAASKKLGGDGWIGAKDGGKGSDGKEGGDGGNGGNVKLLLAINQHPYRPEPNVNGGQPGEGGEGGKGGKGGKGCTGLGGTQDSHPKGHDGNSGDKGILGSLGNFISRDIKFRYVKNILEDSNIAVSSQLEAAKQIILESPIEAQ